MKRLRPLAILFVGSAVVVAVMAIMGGWDSWTTLRADVSDFAWVVRPVPLSLALVLGVGALLSTGFLWASLFRRAGGRAPAGEAVAAWLGSNLGRYLPGKIWQLTGITAWFRARGDSGAAGFGTSLALQAVMLVVGGCFALAFGGGAVLGDVDPVAVAVAGVALLVALHPWILNGIIRRGAQVLKEPEPEGSLTAREVLWTAAGAGLVWVVYGLGLHTLIGGLAPAFRPSVLEATGIFAAAYVAGYVVLIAPGGLVVREGALAALLVATTGIPAGAAAAVAVAARIWTTLSELLAFGVAAGGLRRGGAPR